MKAISLIDYSGYITVKVASFLFGLIPISLGLWFARSVGQLIYYLNIKRRIIAYRNLKAGMGSTLSPKDIKRIIKKMYQNLTQMLVEFLTVPRINKKYIDKFVSIEGTENLENAKKLGKGIIFLTGHFGNWELLNITAPVKGYPILALAREQKHSRLNALLNEYREATGSKVIKKGFALKEMLSALHNNKIIGMLVDQDAGKNGVFVDFFGRKTSSAHGPMSFALRTDATILPTFMVRIKGPYHKVMVEKPLRIKKTEDAEADIKNGLQKFAAILESYVRKHPEQWLWVHKRWKSTSTRRISILNDGKPGHLNQSLAIAEIIQKYRKDMGHQIQDTKYEIRDVEFKNRALKNLCNVGSVFAEGACQGCMRCLRFCLKKHSYKKLIGEYADIVISCGASLEGVNLLMAKETGAKNIIIMKPSVIGINRFSLVIAPRHDRLKQRGNVVVTEGAPNRITEERLHMNGQLLSRKINLDKKIRIGLLIGGNNPEFRLNTKIIHALIDAVIELSCDIDAEILVTTSRRTPKDVEEILKERLGKHLRCPFLVIANEKNMDEAVGGILALSQIVIVSCESISMISEALNSSNYKFVFELEKLKKGPLKHELFLRYMAESGYVEFVKVDELYDRVKKVWEQRPPIKKLADNTKIYEAVKKII